MEREKVLEVKDLTKIYKNNRGISSVTLDVYRGDIFGFLGPNGAGKTTAMKIMTGLMRPDSGYVKVFGYDVSQNFEKAMQKVGSIIEIAQSYEYLTAYQNLKLASRFYKGIKPSRIDEVLEIIGISKYKNEKVKNFSLGMKQRLGIAQAILSKPELLILDEPLNGLDIEGMVEMRGIIKKLVEEEQTTFFISSHLVHDMELTCSRVAVIYEGKIVKVEDVDKILKDYSSLENFFISEVDKDE